MKIPRRQLALAGCACAMASATFAQDQEANVLATTEIFTNEIEILSDGTWRFVEPGISVADIDIEGQICTQIGEGRVEYCHPEGEWARSVVFAADGVEEYVYRHPSGITLSVTSDSAYGHDGDFEYYQDVSQPGVVGWLVDKALGAVFGVEFEQESTIIVNDIIYYESMLSDNSYSLSMNAELMVESESIWIDLTGLKFLPEHDWDEMSAEHNKATQDIYTSIAIEGQSLQDILGQRGGE